MADGKSGPSLRPVPETDEAETTLLSSHVSRRDGYTRMPSDGAIDISSFEQRLSPSPSPDQGLGISSFSSTPRRPISRVPVGSKTSSPVSARYYHGLLSSPQETHSDERQAVTPDMGDSPIFEPPVDSPKGTRTPSRLRKWFSGTWSKAAPPAYDMAEQPSPNFSRPPPQRDEETALRLGDRDGMGEHSSHSSPADDDDANEECDKPLHERYRQVPNYCSSTKDVRKRRVSWLSVSILTLRSHPNPTLLSQDQDHDSMDVAAGDTQRSEAQKAKLEAEKRRKENEIPQELLRKYILYARDRLSPKLYHMDEDKVARLFADMRRESLATGAYPITVRHLEAIIRISEAFCRMRLSEYCSSHDIDRAIAVTVESFVGSQKVSCKKALARAFAKYTLARPGAGTQSQRSAGTSQASRRTGTAAA
ncbi:hypothetical protein BN1723_014253 [Verticillium longisporum]|uniref:MCM AAA-lid domain-containing protein n=1 Tax=Verticillium longisporum TaxID=100787 RepID=A0A0G4M4W5_VERLO|nr:hypothetical protein BN1723_014253 [Verticillium longisporum]